MQSAYFSYPRDFDGTDRRQAASVDRRGGNGRASANFRAVFSSEKPGSRERTSPEFTQPHRNVGGGLGSSLAPAIQSHVAIPSRPRETNRFLSFLHGGPPRLDLLLPRFPASTSRLFIVPPRISALFAVLPIALPSPAPPAKARRPRKVFLRSPVRSRCDSCRDLARRHGNKKGEAYENTPGENKAIPGGGREVESPSR